MKSNNKIAFIIPCYNEEKRLPFSDFTNFIAANHVNISFLFVNDGSKDNTEMLLNKLIKDSQGRASLLSLKNNQGKAEAIRQGMIQLATSTGDNDYIGFMDADLAVPLDEIFKLDKAITDFENPAMLIGSRIKLFGSTEIIRSNRRHYIGRMIATLISKSLKLPIYDTQCGFKAIRKDMVMPLFKDPFISRWLCDVELIFRLLALTGYYGIKGQLFEMPMSKWQEKGDSRIPLTYAFKMPFELLKIRKRYRKVLD